MKLIGLTGGSGTGKGTVATLFCQLGAVSIDADAVYHQLCRTDREMLNALRDIFGDVLAPDGTLDRKKLAPIVFADAQKLQILTELTTPYIKKAVQKEISQAQTRAFVLLDAPTLYETGLDGLCAQVIAVLADAQTRVARIVQRDGLTAAAASARVLAQPADAFYRARADYIIENNADLNALSDTVKQLFDTIMKQQ